MQTAEEMLEDGLTAEDVAEAVGWKPMPPVPSALFKAPEPLRIQPLPTAEELLGPEPTAEEMLAPDLSQVKLSAYEKAYLETGRRDPGMLPGTELTEAIGRDPAGLVKSLPGSAAQAAMGPGTVAYAAAADVVSKVAGEPEYGGNIAAMGRGEDVLPAERLIGEAAKSSPKLAGAAYGMESLAQMAPLGAVRWLPVWAQRLVAGGFSLQMVLGAPEQFKAFAEEQYKPEEEQDAGKLSKAWSDLIQTGVFAPLAGGAAAGGVPVGRLNPKLTMASVMAALRPAEGAKTTEAPIPPARERAQAKAESGKQKAESGTATPEPVVMPPRAGATAEPPSELEAARVNSERLVNLILGLKDVPVELVRAVRGADEAPAEAGWGRVGKVWKYVGIMKPGATAEELLAGTSEKGTQDASKSDQVQVAEAGAAGEPGGEGLPGGGVVSVAAPDAGAGGGGGVRGGAVAERVGGGAARGREAAGEGGVEVGEAPPPSGEGEGGKIAPGATGAQVLGAEGAGHGKSQMAEAGAGFSATTPVEGVAADVSNAKAQAAVNRTVVTEGVSSGKEAKATWIEELKKAIAEAPSEEKWPGLRAERAKQAKSKFGIVDKEFWAKAKEEIGTVTIDIPGDGKTTILNTKEALQFVLDRAKSISTKANDPTKIKRQGTSDEDKTWIKEQIAGQAKQQAEARHQALTEKAEELRRQYNLTMQRMLNSRVRDVRLKLQQDLASYKAELDKAQAAGREAAQEIDRLSGPMEQRIEREQPGRKADPFEMDDGDLADLLEERFGTGGAGGGELAAGRVGDYTFRDYTAFAKWMDARYGERDVEGMKLGFAEADTAQKIRYIKENRGADAHKKDWIAHLATGALLPAADGPVARTTPRPTASGAPATGPGARPPGAPTHTGQPPPPPRTPTPYRKFDVMALTQLFRQWSKFPTVNDRLTRAYGRFIPGKEAVELKARLLWDTKLAERVLGHEIGHFIDLIVQEIGKGKRFAERLMPLWDFRGEVWRKAELRNEARELSREWRGDFVRGDKYRDTATELFADFMSAMFNNPEWVNQRYPKLHDAFQQLRDGKPGFKYAYREIETWLQGGTMAAEWVGQQREAVKRTLHDLMKVTPRHRENIKDWLKGAFVSIWHRAYGKEGAPGRLGASLTDELEYSKSWAAKENAIFANEFKRRVQPELDRVNADPLEARSLLHAYSQARRTIGERRAAGQWIEANPAAAREMIEHVIGLDPSLQSKFGAELGRTPDAGLYDFAAAVFREVHDRGERFADRMAREIDGLQLGVGGDAALQAFNVRGKLLNPGGLTDANARKVLADLHGKLSQAQWTALETAGRELRRLYFELQRQAHDEGLIPDKVWKELIEPNADNYVPYAVLDYWEGRVRGGSLPQKGTAKDVADVTLAMQLKAGALNAWRQRQRQVQLLRQVYEAGGTPIAVGERLKRAGDLDRKRQQHPDDDVSRGVIWQDGQAHLVEFPGDAGKTFEKALDSASFYEHMEWLTDASRLTHGIMQLYTTLSIPFLVYRNPLRGVRTGALRVGFRGVGKQLLSPERLKESAAMAKNYAEAAFGGIMSPEVQALVDKQVILPPRLSSAMVRDAANLKDLLETGGVLATELRGLHGEHWSWWKGGKPGRLAFEFAEKVFSGYEAFEKIYNYHAALERGLGEPAAVAIGRRSGIPKPGVGGHFSLVMEAMFPWTRVHLQGIRADLDMLRDPVLRKGFVTRFVVTEAMPRLLKVAVGAGVAAGTISWLTGNKDEDPKDPVMAEVMRRGSPYKMALDDNVPLMLYDSRSKKYHYFNEFKSGREIPSHYEVVSFRIPASEEGRLWGTLLYSLLTSMPGAKETMGRPGADVVSNMADWVKNYLAPGISPLIRTSDQLYDMILRGRNPEDSYRGQPAANVALFDAGGMDRAQAIAGYTLNQLGGPGEIAAVMAMNLGLLDARAAGALKKRISADATPLVERVPLARSAFSYDNYAQYRVEKGAQLAEQELRAKARLVMSSDVREVYDYYWKNYTRQEKLTAEERRRFIVAGAFVKYLWGSMDREGSFYQAAAHAVGPDGSRQARETVRRDLDAASAGVLLQFRP